MKKIIIKKTIAAALTAAALLGVLPIAAGAQARTGWVEEKGKFYYYNSEGVMEKNTTIQGYKLGEDGAWIEDATKNKSNLTTEEDATQNTEGKWKKEGSRWSFYNKDGVILKDKTIMYNGREYRLASDGGWVEDPNVHSLTTSKDTEGTFKLDGTKWYFYNKSGQLVKNTTVTLGGEAYKLDADGAWVKEQSYLTNNNGAQGKWLLDQKQWHYRYDGENSNVKGWINCDGQWYYLDEDGVMLQNTSKTIENKEYKFEDSGVCTNY